MSWVHLIWYSLLILSPFIYSGGDPELFGNVAKVFSLLICSLSLTFTQNTFSTNDTPQKAWTLIAASMWIWFFAQIILFYYKIIARDPNSYPSIADAFFMLAYIPLIIGVIFLIKNFKSTGLPMGTQTSYVVQILILMAIYALIFVTLLYQLLVTNDPPALKFLNVGYPTCDFIMISLSSVLVRISWTLRGGSLARSWMLLCAGFTLLGAADITFAYHAYPLLDVVYFSGYFLIGLAGVYQIRMLRQ
jgi:hypothetical protein